MPDPITTISASALPAVAEAAAGLRLRILLGARRGALRRSAGQAGHAGAGHAAGRPSQARIAGRCPAPAPAPAAARAAAAAAATAAAARAAGRSQHRRGGRGGGGWGSGVRTSDPGTGTPATPAGGRGGRCCYSIECRVQGCRSVGFGVFGGVVDTYMTSLAAALTANVRPRGQPG